VLRCFFINKEGDIMHGKRHTQICDICNSHISAYRENGKIIISCSYCGHLPEDIQLSIDLEDEDE
jgi:hypothetical protein